MLAINPFFPENPVFQTAIYHWTLPFLLKIGSKA